MDTHAACIVYISSGTDAEADLIASALVDERLSACCTILPNTVSRYRWEGAVRREEECLIVCKTSIDRYPALEQRVRELHSYEIPEILCVPVSDGHAPYLSWLHAETRPTAGGNP